MLHLPREDDSWECWPGRAGNASCPGGGTGEEAALPTSYGVRMTVEAGAGPGLVAWFLLTLLQHRTCYKNKTHSFISPIMQPCLRHTAQPSVQAALHTTPKSVSPLPAAQPLCHRQDCWNQAHQATAPLGKGNFRSNSFPQQTFPASKHRETKTIQITWPCLPRTGETGEKLR